MTSHLRRYMTIVCLVGFGGCDASTSAPEETTAGFTLDAAAKPAASCVNVAAEAAGHLGLWAEGGFGGFGLKPSPITLGDDEGMMASFVSSETISGSKGQGAHHIILNHVFWSSDGVSWFLTDDEASCAPADNDPATCLVNDNLRIVDGAGNYANAAGHLKNHGLITFTSFAPPAGTLDLRIKGRVCGDGVN